MSVRVLVNAKMRGEERSSSGTKESGEGAENAKVIAEQVSI